MSIIIEDGKGSGSKAQIDAENRVRVRGTSDDGTVDAVADGRLFAVATNVVNLTSDGHSHLLYIKNEGEEDIHLTHVNLQFGTSTNGSGDYQSIVIVNPTAGTLLTAGTPSGAGNLNSGSAKILDVTVTIGSEGSTATGAVPITDLFSNVPNRYQVPINVRLSRGKAISFSMKPPTGNTSCDVAITVVLYKVNPVDQKDA